MSEQFSQKEIIELGEIKEIIGRKTGQLPGVPISARLTDCQNSVITSAAGGLIGLILSEMNDKGKINWFRGFSIVGKLYTIARDVITQLRACKGQS